MNHPQVGRSFYAVAAFGTVLVAGAAVSHVASGQSGPSPTQVKKATQTLPLPPTNRQVPLPGFTKPGSAPSAQAGAPVAGGDPPKQASVKLIDGEGDEKTGIARGKNVIYTEADMTFTGQTAVYNKNTLELDTQGSLVLDDPKHHVTGDKCHVYRTKRLAVMNGNIVITLKPAPPDPNAPDNPDRAKQRQYPVIITCDHADDFYKKNFIVLTGHLVFKQTIMKDNGKMVERTLTADHAEYDGKTDKLHLFEPVKASDSEGQKSEFEKDVFVGTKEGEETLNSTGKSNIYINVDEAPEDDPAEDQTTPDKKEETPVKKVTPPPTPKTPN